MTRGQLARFVTLSCVRLLLESEVGSLSPQRREEREGLSWRSSRLCGGILSSVASSELFVASPPIKIRCDPRRRHLAQY